MNQKYINIGLVGLLIITIAGGGFGWFSSVNNARDLMAQKQADEQIIADLQGKIDEQGAIVVSLKGEINENQLALNEKAVAITDLETRLDKAEKDAERYRQVMLTREKEYTALEKEAVKLKTMSQCTDSFEDGYKFDYRSNATVSNGLIDYVEREASVEKATWKAVWTSAKTAIHDVRAGGYSYQYIVWLNDNEFGFKPAVLDIANQCFVEYK